MLRLRKRRKNGLWVLASQLSARGNQLMTKIWALRNRLIWTRVIQVHAFSHKVSLSLTLTPKWSIWSISFRRDVPKGQPFLSCFSVHNCERTRDYYICYTISLQILNAHCNRQHDKQVSLKFWFESAQEFIRTL